MAVEQAVSRQRRVPGIESRLRQQVLRVQHLGHGEAVAEALVERGERVLHGGGGLQAARAQFSTRVIQRLHTTKQ